MGVIAIPEQLAEGWTHQKDSGLREQADMLFPVCFRQEGGNRDIDRLLIERRPRDGGLVLPYHDRRPLDRLCLCMGHGKAFDEAGRTELFPYEEGLICFLVILNDAQGLGLCTEHTEQLMAAFRFPAEQYLIVGYEVHGLPFSQLLLIFLTSIRQMDAHLSRNCTRETMINAGSVLIPVGSPITTQLRQSSSSACWYRRS